MKLSEEQRAEITAHYVALYQASLRLTAEFDRRHTDIERLDRGEKIDFEAFVRAMFSVTETLTDFTKAVQEYSRASAEALGIRVQAIREL